LFEFAELRFRPLEKEDLKLVHAWENDFELMMYSRNQPLNTVSMTQLEERYTEWMKNERNIYFIVENMESKEPIGFASIRRDVWAHSRRRHWHLHRQERILGKGPRQKNNRCHAGNGFHAPWLGALSSVERRVQHTGSQNTRSLRLQKRRSNAKHGVRSRQEMGIFPLRHTPRRIHDHTNEPTEENSRRFSTRLPQENRTST
jgi:hypothetical protein